MKELLDKLTAVVSDYLCAQIEAGAAAVQIFDTWGGILAPDEYRAYSLEYTARIVANVKKTEIPVIFYCKGASPHLNEIAETGVDVIGIDWTYGIGDAR